MDFIYFIADSFAEARFDAEFFIGFTGVLLAACLPLYGLCCAIKHIVVSIKERIDENDT